LDWRGMHGNWGRQHEKGSGTTCGTKCIGTTWTRGSERL